MNTTHNSSIRSASTGDIADSRASACENSCDGKPSGSYMTEDRYPTGDSGDEYIQFLEYEPTLPRVSIQEVPSRVWDRSYKGAAWVAELPDFKIPCKECNNPVYLESEACTRSQMHKNLYITGISVLQWYSWYHRRDYPPFGPEDLKVLVNTGEPPEFKESSDTGKLPEFEESRGRTVTVSSLFIAVGRLQSEFDSDWLLNNQRQY
jgi:hypothetical protein